MAAFCNIAAERARRGMSQEELAQRLGITRKTLYNWEQSGKIPEERLYQMAAIFNTSPMHLMGLVEDRQTLPSAILRMILEEHPELTDTAFLLTIAALLEDIAKGLRRWADIPKEDST